MAEIVLPPGVDPTDPEVIERMRRQARQIEAENAPPASLVEMDDLTDAESLAGRPCRPISAALFAMLEKIGSPLAISSPDGEKEKEIGITDMQTALYMLYAPVSNDELVELVRAGTVEDAAMAWGQDIPFATFNRMCGELKTKLEAINTQGVIYTGDDPADGDPKKKAASLGIG